MPAIAHPLRHVHLYDLSTELFVLGFHIDSGLLILFLTYAAIDGFEPLIHRIKIIIFWYNSTRSWISSSRSLRCAFTQLPLVPISFPNVALSIRSSIFAKKCSSSVKLARELARKMSW